MDTGWFVRSVVAAGVLGFAAFGGLEHISGHHSASAPAAEKDCDTTVIATDGTPPPGAPVLDPQKLCHALEAAEATAACLGDSQPPTADVVNAREFCLEVQRRGCGVPGRDCSDIPAEQTYYYRH